MRLRILHIEDGSERKRAMRSGEKQRIKNLPVCGGAACELLSVPARDSVKIGRRRRGLRFRRGRGAADQSQKAEGRRQKSPDVILLPSAFCFVPCQTRTSAVPRVTS